MNNPLPRIIQKPFQLAFGRCSSRILIFQDHRICLLTGFAEANVKTE